MVVAAALALAGCATAPPLPYPNWPPPSSDSAQSAAMSYLESSLRNPRTAEVEFIGDVFAFQHRLMGASNWAQCAWVNAENGYGGMTGRQVYLFLYGDVVRQDAPTGPYAVVRGHWAADGRSYIVDEAIGDACANALFAPQAAPKPDQSLATP